MTALGPVVGLLGRYHSYGTGGGGLSAHLIVGWLVKALVWAFAWRAVRGVPIGLAMIVVGVGLLVAARRVVRRGRL